MNDSNPEINKLLTEILSSTDNSQSYRSNYDRLKDFVRNLMYHKSFENKISYILFILKYPDSYAIVKKICKEKQIDTNKEIIERDLETVVHACINDITTDEIMSLFSELTYSLPSGILLLESSKLSKIAPNVPEELKKYHSLIESHDRTINISYVPYLATLILFNPFMVLNYALLFSVVASAAPPMVPLLLVSAGLCSAVILTGLIILYKFKDQKMKQATCVKNTFKRDVLSNFPLNKTSQKDVKSSKELNKRSNKRRLSKGHTKTSENTNKKSVSNKTGK